MSGERFVHRAIYRTEERIPPATGLICSEITRGPYRAVIWSHYQKKWAFNPNAAAPFMFDLEYMDRGSKISREDAERIAREQFVVPLPREEELKRICDHGEQAEKPNP